MTLNDHSSLIGKHSLLSPSKYHWLFDTDEDFEKRFAMSFAQTIGTIMHDFARKRIEAGALGRLTKYEKRSVLVDLIDNGVPIKVIEYYDFDAMYDNLCTYVNDCIGFRMKPEVVLYFNEYSFGTADALLYDERNRTLRIHDLKTGNTPAKMDQLYVYAALYFLEYRYLKPGENKIELRIYQSNEVIIDIPEIDTIVPIMEKIKHLTGIAGRMKGEQK